MAVEGPAVEELQDRILREVNDRVHEVLMELGADDAQGKYLCECGGVACLETVALHVHEYEAIRSSGGIVTLPGHERC